MAAMVLAFASPVLAGNMPYPIENLSNGAVEIVKSPIEIYDHTKGEMDHANFIAFGLVKGLVESPFYVTKKLGHGVLDIATFLVK